MWLDSRSGGWSIARLRAEVLAGQAGMAWAKAAMTLADVIETRRLHGAAGLTGAHTALTVANLGRAQP